MTTYTEKDNFIWIAMDIQSKMESYKTEVLEKLKALNEKMSD